MKIYLWKINTTSINNFLLSYLQEGAEKFSTWPTSPKSNQTELFKPLVRIRTFNPDQQTPPSKVMLYTIHNYLKSKAEELLSEKQADFRAGWSKVGQSTRVLIEKHLQNQRDRFHNFIDFQESIWLAMAWWHILRGFSIEEWLIQVIYAHVTSAVVLSNQVGDFFQTTNSQTGMLTFSTVPRVWVMYLVFLL